MWVQYKNKLNGQTKKFNLPKDITPPTRLEDTPGSGAFCWKLDVPIHISEVKLPKKKTVLLGYAVLIKDDISGKNRWATFNNEGTDHVNYGLDEPLVFPTAKFQLGTKIEIHVPE
jgi:hypothetical protein